MKVMKTMNDNLEFHYVVSYRQGYGWQHALDVEQAVMTDGTIYDWTQGVGWIVANDELETIDLDNYRLLKSALYQLNQGEIINA
jgi:hypothetical protein